MDGVMRIAWRGSGKNRMVLYLFMARSVAWEPCAGRARLVCEQERTLSREAPICTHGSETGSMGRVGLERPH